MTPLDKKSDAKVMPKLRAFSKTDSRHWIDKVFHRRRGGREDPNWTVQMQVAGRREQVALGTPVKADAAARAAKLFLSAQAKGWDAALAELRPKMEPKRTVGPAEANPATVGDLIRAVQATVHFRASTFSIYCSALRKIAFDISGAKAASGRFRAKGPQNTAWRNAADAVLLESLTPEAINHWKLAYLKARGSTPEVQSRASNSVNSYLRCARSLFTERAIEFARKMLVLPDPLPFSTAKLERRKTSTRYVSRIDPEKLIEAARKELGENPARTEQYKIFCLALLCGLRKREIDTLLWDSIDFSRALLRVEQTKYFQPKTEDSIAEVDLAPELVELLKNWKKGAAGEFVIESPNPPRYEASRTNYRATTEFDALYAWLLTHGVNARKKLHELRKECGAIIANSLGIFAASRALRHSDIRITSQYYADKKLRITTGLDHLLVGSTNAEAKVGGLPAISEGS